MVACFATAEFISLFERKHKEAAELYRNVCFRPKTDKSPNGFLVDGTKAYPAGCFNLAKMHMTMKGGVPHDNAEAYRLLDRACRGSHGGACYLQAQILCTRPGSLGPGVPHDPLKAMQLYQQNCDEGDSTSCFTLACMLLRGEHVSKTADNVSPQEARGVAPLATRENEPDRHITDEDKFYVIPRDPQRAEKLMLQACNTGFHVTACHNLVVMYTQGDDGVPIDQEKADHYAKKTESMMGQFAGF
jgi:TPR repeat protein